MSAKKTEKKNVKKRVSANTKAKIAEARAGEPETGINRRPSGSGQAAVRRVIGQMLLIAVVVIAVQLSWAAMKFAGQSIAVIHKFRQFREFSWDDRPVPPPFDRGVDLGELIRKHFPRTISDAERRSVARVFTDAADAVDAGTLINRDDVFGYLGKHLRPVCRNPAWIPLLNTVWEGLDLADDAPADKLAAALRAVAQGLDGVSAPAILLGDALADVAESEEPTPETPAAEPVAPQVEPAPVTPTRTGSTRQRNSWGGWPW